MGGAMDNSVPIDDHELRILRDRARALAVAPVTAPVDGDLINALRFKLGDETYAIEYRHIREVLPLPRVTPLPCVPLFVRGIINIRGRIVSLLDLRSILGMQDAPRGPTSSAIIPQSTTVEFGLLADEILGLSAILLSSIQTSLPTLTGVGAEYLRGITAEGLVLLDAGKLLADEKLVINEAVGEMA